MRRRVEAHTKQERARFSFGKTAKLKRRAFLRSASAGIIGLVTGVQLSACSNASQRRASDTPIQIQTKVPTQTASTGSKVLLVYFSRAGENYYYGGRSQLEVGNTEVMASMISRLIKCEVYRITPVNPYPDDYEETVARNVQEQNANARPAIAQPLTSIAAYDIVLLGSPIWNVRAPMIMTTFVEGFDFTGKTIFPFVTYAVSGLGTVIRDYTKSCRGATVGEGLAVRGEEVRGADDTIESWLQRIHLLK